MGRGEAETVKRKCKEKMKKKGENMIKREEERKVWRRKGEECVEGKGRIWENRINEKRDE